MNKFSDFYNDKSDIGRINYGVITLLPKHKDADKIQQSRHICLLNVVYKVFTKTLIMRLEKVMDKIIKKCKYGFLKERNIMDGVMVLHEILNDTKVKKQEGLLLKLDFEKAYDKINWNFLFECLNQRGFKEKWCKWIGIVMTTGTLSVKVNNAFGPYFKFGKEVRQGDPLSPFLFNIDVDILAKMIALAQKNKLLTW